MTASRFLCTWGCELFSSTALNTRERASPGIDRHSEERRALFKLLRPYGSRPGHVCLSLHTLCRLPPAYHGNGAVIQEAASVHLS